MKKTLVAIAAFAAVSAFAQSSVTISGGASVGLMNTGAVNTGTKAAHLGNGANAININSKEDLGNGLSSGFDAQIRYNIGTGDVNSSGAGNALFHNANVYLSSKTLGTIRAGKIAEVSNCNLDPWGCTAGAGLMGGEGLSALVGASTNAGAVGYTTPTIAGFSATITKAEGTGTRNQRNSALVKYENGPLLVQYVETNGAANAVANGALGAAATAATNAHEFKQSIGASYDLGKAKVMVTNNITKDAAEAKTVNVTSYGLTAPMGQYTLLAGYNTAKTGGSYTATTANNAKTSVGVNYSLSKRTTLGADLFKAKENANTGYVVRMAHTF